MIEVMVTIVVVAFGLLGLASLVLRGLQAGSTSQLRSIAVAQVYDMADRMRGNITAVGNNDFIDVLPSGTASTCATMLSKITDTSDTTFPLVAAGSSTPTCSGTGSARDINCWQAANASLLPKGSGAICKDALNKWYAVIVSWDEGKTGSTNKSFWITFEP